MYMKMSVVGRLSLLVLSLSFVSLTTSYARNDQKGGHSSGGHSSGGHGPGVDHHSGGQRGGPGGAVQMAPARSFAAHSSSHVGRAEHSAGSGATPGRQTVSRDFTHRSQPERTQSAARGGQKAAAP